MFRVQRISVVLVLALLGSGTSQPAPADLFNRARKYVADFEERFSLLVAEERYEQEQREQVASGGGNLTRENPRGGFSAPSMRGQRRVLRSDYLLVKLPDGGGWMPFRDVFEVDGRRIRDREDRLLELFLKPAATSLAQAQRIMQESTRYNLGSVTRTINIPILALLLLDATLASRFEFTSAGEERIGDTSAGVVRYVETQQPSLISSGPGRDLPLSGRFWIDPATGAVRKTVLAASAPTVRTEITVTFAEDKALGLWVPVLMEELYVEAGDDRETKARAQYSNHRRFTVTTEEVIRKPPPGA
jgi:hypothetical protein